MDNCFVLHRSDEGGRKVMIPLNHIKYVDECAHGCIVQLIYGDVIAVTESFDEIQRVMCAGWMPMSQRQ